MNEALTRVWPSVSLLKLVPIGREKRDDGKDLVPFFIFTTHEDVGIKGEGVWFGSINDATIFQDCCSCNHGRTRITLEVEGHGC